MRKQHKLLLTLAVTMLSACSLSSYLPFTGADKPVINLSEEKIDQKSYAVAYSATLQTNGGRVNEDYDVNSFASGAKDWYAGAILVPLEQIKAKLTQGIDTNVHAYYSGVVFASELQNNFSRLGGEGCWGKIDRPSMTQGIYDAMLDLKKGKPRAEDDEYLVQGSEQLLKVCK
ncbi:hypothetical protein EDC45_0005 [Mesocricetibacter intestinalis]|uniref:Lipoprotein n=1 Tax=Mesocricetibacter intestinalis TaxID=1521930 RepID=A0A4R6VAX8_9PAST|nr:hypothetical protein [Mesocricetibacter intestinalis]TDQ59358.1 hypothetical protein EDC45_0005 [Mesocricetibacter intestinalis]